MTNSEQMITCSATPSKRPRPESAGSIVAFSNKTEISETIKSR